MSPKNSVLRPPGALAEADFLRRCVQCGQCVYVCSRQAVRMEGGLGPRRNTPVIRPREMPCWLCMKCPPVCPSEALDNSVTSMEQANMGRAVLLKDRCHNYTNNVMCWTCYDRCPLKGRAMILQHGYLPMVTEHCVGCGMCEYVCAVDAMRIIPRGAAPHAS